MRSGDYIKSNNILIHIPHSSIIFPKLFYKVCIKDKNYINKSAIFMSDYMVDKLVPKGYKTHIFKYSRLFCDVERFKSNKEEMNKYGMGFIYENDCDNKITIINNKYKNIVTKSYYDKHHNKLDKLTSNIINKHGKCIMIDLHSYSDKMVYSIFKLKNNPDICIGIDDKFTSNYLKKITINHFEKYGYTIKINYPYSGTIIPNKFYNKKSNKIDSIMIEINKRIYENSKDFIKLKECIKKYLKGLI